MGTEENLVCFAENPWITVVFLWKVCGTSVESSLLWKTQDILYFEDKFLLRTIYCVQKEIVKEKIMLRKKVQKTEETIAVRQIST